MSNNMKVWDAVKQPPDDALKTIQGGRLKGMSDINPQWRYQVMTEQFGMCGIGWKYESDVWTEPAPNDQVFAFARVKLYVKVDGEWSEPIPGVGGSMLVVKETAGLHVSDEGFKMAITDALSVAMKMLGVAANVYAGLHDTKYKPPAKQTLKKDFDMTTTEGALEYLESKNPRIWGHSVVAARLMTKYGIGGNTMSELLKALSPEQMKEFATIVSNEVIKVKE